MWRKGLSLILMFQLIEIGPIHCDFYTSIAGLEELLESEIYLLETYDNYLKQVNRTNQAIISFLDEVEANFENIEENPASYFENPVNAFKVLKRWTLDWESLKNIVLENSDGKDYALNISAMNALDYASANEEDLLGASKALARLQSIYGLEAADIAEGVLLDYVYSTTLSAHDCFQLGAFLNGDNQIKYARQWLLESRLLLKALENNEKFLDFPFLSDVNILEHLAANMYDSGNKKMAQIFNEELLLQDPTNEYGLANKNLFEDGIKQERREDVLEQPPSIEISDKKPTVDELYAAVCRGELKRTPSEQRPLRCRYTSRGVPFCHLAPFKMEELSHDPFVAFFHEAIYDHEMVEIIDTAKDFVERSEIGDDEDASFSEERTSKNTWLYFEHDKFLRPIRQRLQDITGLNLHYAEPLQVVNYGIGGHYVPHNDFSEHADEDYQSAGNRLLTALFYINDVELGGATAFPFLKLAVPPIRGGLLLWFNMHDSLELDYRVKHAGCPVIKGSKWVCNQWFHERGQELIRPCSVQQNGQISLKYKNEI